MELLILFTTCVFPLGVHHLGKWPYFPPDAKAKNLGLILDFFNPSFSTFNPQVSPAGLTHPAPNLESITSLHLHSYHLIPSLRPFSPGLLNHLSTVTLATL